MLKNNQYNKERSVIDYSKEHDYLCTHCTTYYFMHFMWNSFTVVVVVIVISSSKANVIMVIHILRIITYWLFRNCMQELGSRAREWEKVINACKIKLFVDGKFMVYGSNCWNVGNFCTFFPKKFGTIFAGKLISGTHTVNTPVLSNDITIFFLMTDIRVHQHKCLNDQSDWL